MSEGLTPPPGPVEAPEPLEPAEPLEPVEAAEEYDGPAVLVVADGEVDGHAHLSGHFEPITGRYQWAGRLRPSDEVSAAVRQNAGSVRLRTPFGHEADAAVREQDPWGGFRITGTGRPPFDVPSEPG
ncbi:MAG: DUF4873 domain-containing protein [Nocardioidaceae bacterium]